MTKKLIPITLQPIPNSKSVMAAVHLKDKIEVLELSEEDIASLREEIITYYKNRGHIQDYKLNPVLGVKPKLKPIKDDKKITISAKLYKQLQHLYTQNKHLDAELKRAKAEIKRLNQLIKQS